ncbi:MAG: metal ABC transporter permease [Clostridia bacterium]|nr:metal ABC transporter permease [Clostridia bacterium]
MQDLSLWAQFAQAFSYSFVIRALIAGVFISLSSSLLGVTLVLKRFSFIGDGLSHVAFGAMALASVLFTALKISDELENAWEMAIMLVITTLCAVLLLRAGQKARMGGDAAVATVSVGALAFGYLFLNKFSTSGNLSGDVCSTLFGSTSILTLKTFDVVLCVCMSLVVTLLFVFMYHKIFAVTFDESFARATGVRASLYNLLISVIVAVIIVLAMNLVGSLLISALVIFPALSSMRVFKSFRAVTICSAVFSVVCSFTGIMVSVPQGTPVGSTIVAIDVAGFALFCFIGFLRRVRAK